MRLYNARNVLFLPLPDIVLEEALHHISFEIFQFHSGATTPASIPVMARPEQHNYKGHRSQKLSSLLQPIPAQETDELLTVC